MFKWLKSLFGKVEFTGYVVDFRESVQGHTVVFLHRKDDRGSVFGHGPIRGKKLQAGDAVMKMGVYGGPDQVFLVEKINYIKHTDMFFANVRFYGYMGIDQGAEA